MVLFYLQTKTKSKIQNLKMSFFTIEEINKPNIPTIHSYFSQSLALLDINTGIAPTEFIQYQQKWEEVLATLKTTIKKFPDEFIPYIESIEKQIIHTRDCYHGKGERAISYVTLDVLYRFYPLIAIRLVHKFVKQYGSWRDIKELCHYLYTSSTQNTKDGFIASCIYIVNEQLLQDLQNQKKDTSKLSLLAKWIPRENKKHHWLFERLALDWYEKYEGFNPNNSLCQPYYKMQYRRMVAKLNRLLNTMEIKLCEKKCNQIHPENVPKIAMMKQKRQMIFKNIAEQTNEPISMDRLESMLKFKHYLTNQYLLEEAMDAPNKETLNVTESKRTIYVPVHLLVKEAMEILQKMKTPLLISSILDTKNYVFQMAVLNKQWEQMTNQMNHGSKTLANYIPILEMSFELQSSPQKYYQAIGLAIMIAQKSSFGKRILVMDNVCTWINLSECPDFFSMVRELITATESYRNTIAEPINAIHLILNAVNESKLSYYQTRGLTLVFLSTDFPQDDITKTLTTNLKKKDNKIPMPKLVFWNHSVKYRDTLLTNYSEKHIHYLSGGYFPDLLEITSFDNRFENNPLPIQA